MYSTKIEQVTLYKGSNDYQDDLTKRINHCKLLGKNVLENPVVRDNVLSIFTDLIYP